MPIDYPLSGSGYPSPISSAMSRVAAERSMVVPFRFDTDGSVASVSGRSNIIRQQILTLILTYRGERVMRPTYGSELMDAIFEPNSPETMNVVLTGLRHLISSEFPTVEISELSAEAVGDDDEGMSLVLEYLYHDEAPVRLTVPFRILRQELT